MVRHVILWKLKEMPAAEQETVKADKIGRASCRERV